MEGKVSTRDGARAGVIAGLSVIALFLVYDAARLTPLATPMEFATVLFGAGGPPPGLSDSGAARLTQITSAVFRVLGYTTLHLAVFAALGVLAARLSDQLGVRANVVTGALFGVTVCTAVLALSFSLVWPPITTAGWAGILVANAVAGGIIGLVLQSARRTGTSG